MIRHLLIIVLALLLIYGLVEAWPLLAGPTLSISAPLDYTTFPDGTVTVSGRASRISRLTLNGNILLHNEQGDFSTTLTFPRGGSILTLVATDRFGRRITATRNVFVPF